MRNGRGDSLRGLFDQRTAGRWSGQMGGWESGPGVGGWLCVTAGGGQGGSQATPFAAQRLQRRESIKELFSLCSKAFCFHVSATARAALLG